MLTELGYTAPRPREQPTPNSSFPDLHLRPHRLRLYAQRVPARRGPSGRRTAEGPQAADAGLSAAHAVARRQGRGRARPEAGVREDSADAAAAGVAVADRADPDRRPIRAAG